MLNEENDSSHNLYSYNNLQGKHGATCQRKPGDYWSQSSQQVHSRTIQLATPYYPGDRTMRNRIEDLRLIKICGLGFV